MPTLHDTQKYFDRHAGDLQAERLVDKWRAVAPLLSELPPGSSVLECGAGTGLYTMPLLQSGFRVTAVDLSEMCLSQISEKAEALSLRDRLRTKHAEFNEMTEHTTERFDAVVFLKVLHHFPDADSIRQGVRNAYAVLKPGGVIAGFEPNGNCPLWRVWFWVKGREYRENERNVFLIRRRLFESIFEALPDAEWSFAYRFFVPGVVIRKVPVLDRLDRVITESPGLCRVSGNISFVVRRPR